MIKTLIFAQPVKLCPFKTDNEIAEKLWACSGQGNNVDFDEHVLGEAGDLDGGAGGRGVGEVAAVDLIHGGEVGHVLEEDGGFDDLSERAAGGLEDCGEVLQDAFGLDSDVARNDLLGSGIEGDLAERRRSRWP